MIKARGMLVSLAAVLAVVFPAACAFGADAPGVKVELHVKKLFDTPSPAAVKRIGGFVGGRIRADRQGYLLPFDIYRYVRMVEEKKWRQWWWIGEQPGKWLESAVRAAAQGRDARLGDKARSVLSRLVAAQEPGGYLGITDPAVRTADLPLRGMDAYELYFMMHGLETAAEVWNDAGALRAARRLADYFVRTVGPEEEGKAEFWPRPKGKTIAGHDVHCGWEGTLLADPMLRLYEATGEKKYLQWARWAIAGLDRWSGCNAFSRLDDVADGKIGIDEVQPYVHAHTFHMNFLAFLRMYQITGDRSWFRKVEGAWRDIASRQMYITGGVSVGEHYEAGHNLPVTGSVVETCATMSWMELCRYLLELTGDARYGDAIEKLLWNHLFAAQTVDGDSNRYHTPLNGTKPAGYFHGPDCCTASGFRIIEELPLFLYGAGPGGLWVHQFVNSAVLLRLPSGNHVEIVQETDYPREGLVKIEVRPRWSETFSLHVRLPLWCKDPSLKIGKESVEGLRPGTYVEMRRAWRPGDEIILRLPMAPQWVRGEHSTRGRVALRRGPVVYSLDTVWWPEADRKALGGVPADLSREVAVALDEQGFSGTPKRLPTPPRALGPALEVPVALAGGRKIRLPLLPFANTGQWYPPGGARPPAGSAAFAYAVWLYPEGSDTFRALREMRQRLKKTGWTFLSGDWSLGPDGKGLLQRSLRDDCTALGGNPAWRDYVFRVRARKTGGHEGFLVLFRVKDSDNFTWWNIGGWGNTKHGIERETGGIRTVLDGKPGSVADGEWYDIKVVVEGNRIRCYLDAQLIHDIRADGHLEGRIGLGSWRTAVEYTGVRVTTLSGKELYLSGF